MADPWHSPPKTSSTTPGWADGLSRADRRGLSPLFWVHVLPDGQVHLDMAARLQLSS